MMLIKPFGQRKSRFIPPDEAMRQLEELERREAAEQMERIRQAILHGNLLRIYFGDRSKGYHIEDLMRQYAHRDINPIVLENNSYIKPDFSESFLKYARYSIK